MDDEQKICPEAGRIVKPLAEYLAYKDSKPDFKKLTDEEQKDYMVKSIRILEFIDKNNVTFVDSNDPRLQQGTDAKNVEILTEIIKSFVKGIKHPPRVADHFPCEELARRVYEGKI